MKRAFGVLLALAVAAALLAGCKARPTSGPAAAPGLPPGVVAEVGDVRIPAQALETRRKVLTLYYREEADESRLVDELVDQALLVAEARRRGLSVSEAEVEAELARFAGALEARYGGRAELEAAMSQVGLTWADLRRFLPDVLLAERAAAAVRGGVTVPEADLEEFYEENKARLYTFTDDVVRLRHILVPPEARDRAGDVLRRARAGEDFAALAREFSADPASRDHGGDLGYLRRADMDPDMAAVAFALMPGEVGGPVKSEFGWHIIKVDERRPPGTVPFAEARSDVVRRLLPARQAEALRKWLEEQRAAVPIRRATPAPGETAPRRQNGGKG
ncbi:peptidylprolyl isomerase [Caldinitratiruptor microaerophilus]|uniref:PpiC domain-containing protein n=1 Tax=Caldinitratiruptor microaerophilus TaxID=671077 RepID=A0AA35G9C2_9FIRM|nr:peptidyl-prolyl cis-trans isomerase [Caldinitratiruptor microaerophilus]BDG62015.1 hypothetical protein caldi_31050 [Caldinitratiruptor microaerophilus]